MWSASSDGVYKSSKALVGFDDAVVAVVWHPATSERLFLSCGGSVGVDGFLPVSLSYAQGLPL